MQAITRMLAVGAAALTLSGCQLISALVSVDQEGGTALPESGTCGLYALTAGPGEVVSPEALEETRAVIEVRVNALGVADPVVFVDEGQRIGVGLPGLGPESVEEVRGLITAPGVLEFLPVPPELQGSVDAGPLPEAMTPMEPLFTGSEIASAIPVEDPVTGEVLLDLQLKGTGARLFDEFAAQHYGEQFAIVLDEEVLMAPIFRATSFEGRAQITGGQGGFTPEEAARIVTVLKFGPLPLQVEEVSFGECATVDVPGEAPSLSP